MQLSVDGKYFDSVLSALKSNTENDPLILSGVLLHAEDNFVDVTTSNGLLTVTVRCPANVTKAGDALIPCDTLAKQVRTMKSDDVQLNTKGGRLEVKAGKKRSTMSMYDTDDYVTLRKRVANTKLEFDIKLFHEAVQYVSGSANTDSLVQPTLTNIALIPEDKVCRLFGTDGYQMAKEDIECSVPSALDGLTILLSASHLTHALNIVSKLSTMSTAHVYYEDGADYISIEADTIVATLTTSVGKFPDTAAVLISNQEHGLAQFDRGAFINALEFVSSVADRVTLTFMPNSRRIELETENKELGTSKDQIDATYSDIDDVITMDIKAKHLSAHIKYMRESQFLLGSEKMLGLSDVDGSRESVIVSLA